MEWLRNQLARRGVFQCCLAWIGPVLLLASLPGAPAYASEKPSQELIVCPSCELASIKKAVDIAPPGATIRVRGGFYREGNIIIDKPLKLVGEDSPVIDGQGKFEMLTVMADDVTVSGFVLENSPMRFAEDPAAIKVKRAKRCTIQGNRLSNNFFAIYLAASSDCVISDNQVLNHVSSEALSANGIHLWNCRRILVKNNLVRGHRDGLYFEFLHDSEIIGNLSEDNVRYGMHTMYSSDNVYKGNILRRNRAGEVLMYSKQLFVVSNRIEDNWGAACSGALLKDLDQSRLEHNLFRRNSLGIYMENSNRNTIRENEFVNNGIAVRVLADSDENLFEKNAFESNTFDVATNSVSTANNTFHNNYWSEYRGYDLNHDGIGDIPYHPVALFSVLTENYPSAMVLFRSPLAQLLELTERALPALTPSALSDPAPLMERPVWSKLEMSTSAMPH